MKKVFVILVINLFILNTPKVFAHERAVHEMIMYADHYEPTDLEIKQGDTVLFINESEQSMWPASNIHPTHAIYSEFDPQQEIAKGKSWTFTFDKSGEWKYHDHLNPQIEGTIKVLPDEHQDTIKPSYWEFWKEKFNSYFSKTKIEITK